MKKKVLDKILQEERQQCEPELAKKIVEAVRRLDEADNEYLREVYNEMHSKGPSAWFSDGAEERAAILKMGEPWKGKLSLEIGCGEGDLSAMIVSRGGNISANDYSEEAIKRAREKYPDIYFNNNDYKTLKKMNWFEKPYRIVMQGVLEHLDNPWTELKWMMDNLVTDYGDIITSSPGFINPRGITWMALDMLGAVMSKTDLHFINPWDMEDWAKANGYRVAMSTCDLDWGSGKDMIRDLRQRIPLALKDGNLPIDDKKIEDFLNWLEKASIRIPLAHYGGATIIYKIMK